MSKRKCNKHNKKAIFLQISNAESGELYTLKVPENYKAIICDISDSQDYHNSQEMLQFFCELFVDFSHKERSDLEVIVNSKIAKTETVSDLVTIALQLNKYYRLYEVDSYEKLGRFHILAARAKKFDNRIAKSSFGKAEKVGREIAQIEDGRFYLNNYVGRYQTN